MNPPEPTPRLSIVLPAYREAGRIADSIARVRAALPALDAAGQLEIVVVDDGSADGTAEAATGADRVVVLATNRGKGAAVRAGVSAARGAVVAFTDADLAYDPAQLIGLLEQIEAGNSVVVGSRWHPLSKTEPAPSWFRRVTSRMFNVVTRLAVGEWRDTQCGLKGFSADAAQVLFERTTLDGFAFDVELFLAARDAGLVVDEMPVVVQSTSGTTLNLRGEMRAVCDLLRIRRNLRRGAYGPTPV